MDVYSYGRYPKAAMNYLRKKGFAPVVTKDDQKILKAAAAEIDFMGVNYYQSCVCEYNPMDGVTPYGTMNTTGVKVLRRYLESLEFIKIQAIHI